MKRILCLSAVAASLVTACGYNLVGHGGQFPAGVERVTVPIFENTTNEMEIARRLTNNFVGELLATGKIGVVPLSEAQAMIRGTVTRYQIDPITFNAERQALENRLTLSMDVSLVLKGETEPVFEEKGVTVYFEYPLPPLGNLALQQKEEDVALNYVAREMSQKIIALMTEGF